MSGHQVSFGMSGRARKRRRLGEGILGGRPAGAKLGEGPGRTVEGAGAGASDANASSRVKSCFPEGNGRSTQDEGESDIDTPDVSHVDVVRQGLSERPAVDATEEEPPRDGGGAVVSQIAEIIGKRRARVEAGAMDEESAYKLDMEHCPDATTKEGYARVPVESFGASLLKQMGWDGKPDGKSDHVGPVSKLTGGMAAPPALKTDRKNFSGKRGVGSSGSVDPSSREEEGRSRHLSSRDREGMDSRDRRRNQGSEYREEGKSKELGRREWKERDRKERDRYRGKRSRFSSSDDARNEHRRRSDRWHSDGTRASRSPSKHREGDYERAREWSRGTGGQRRRNDSDFADRSRSGQRSPKD